MRCKYHTDGAISKINELEACNIYEDQLVFDTSTYQFVETIPDFAYTLGEGTTTNKTWETNYGL